MDLDWNRLMEEALREAEKAFAEGEVPVGAVVARGDGTVISRAHNRLIALNDPTAHAEILALREACCRVRNYRLPGMVMAVTIEPCPMCMGAILQARIARLAFGAWDTKSGAAGSLYNLAADRRLNHHVELITGVREEGCRRLIREFFRMRRGKIPRRSDTGEVPKWS
ncbi:MAG: nucleoside deaminase [Deltaproteobacteria bacterium]|nr:nucleoside deaminase [Deltaproteobacteria bacterium]MBW1948090.1 nucleoside deaminase [Deltaproteobacteria bacterium]MBW2006515.1 nucleoside deaminase [Deltaproteobacteria bacterium]